ncbi:MAG: methionyl-tRNA formyltransferase [Sedimentisphaerales bacterium]|nr:methionyl-tRNA formyltransferase [Sedimentisphaerales bacterium]
MRIAYFGSGEFGLDCLNAIKGSAHELVFIVTQPPNPAGRGRKPNPTPVANWAMLHSVPFMETSNINTHDNIDKIASCYNPDLILVIAFGQKVSQKLVDLPPKGAINVHASLLPKYRGAAPINMAIINGDAISGVSIITLAQKMDAGAVLAKSEIEIAPDDTAGSLHDKLAQLAAPVLLKTLDKIENGTAEYIEQDHDMATLAPKLSKSDGHIDFSEPAHILERKIRGFWPWPGTSANYVSKETDKSIRVTFAMAEVVENSSLPKLTPGTLDENLNVICGQNALKITQIKPSGSGLMDFKCFVNGRNTKPGDSFTKISH